MPTTPPVPPRRRARRAGDARPWLPGLAALLLAMGAAHPALAQDATVDPFAWLEAVNSPRAMDWVKAENAKTLKVLQGDRRFEALYAKALAIAQAKDRIPAPDLIGGRVYNFWRDQTHIRGVWRRTSQADYATAEPHWTTVLDLDALARTEHANWVWEGADCPPPAYRRCLISLSDGGEDAATLREFDLTTDEFVASGFVLPHGKQSAAWLDADTLLVARDWGPGTMTASGYPFVIKTLKRGQSLDEASEVFRGQPSDVEVDAGVLRDGDGHRLALIQRGTDFFHTQVYQLTDKGVMRLFLPEKVEVDGLLGGSLIVTVQQPWTVQSAVAAAGSIVAVDPRLLTTPWGGEETPNGVSVVFQPTARQSVEQVSTTAHRVIASVYDNVSGRLFSFEDHGQKDWLASEQPVSEHSSVSIVTASNRDDTFYYSVESFLSPTRLWWAKPEADAEAAVPVKSLPDRFDASKDTVDQFAAVSTDGTKIPYFVVHPKAMALNGANPAILYAYGGFQVSETPTYSASLGKLWLERGGVYVLANIRGGGEFGPAWHEAALKTHRQTAFDDFAAVARDLIARKITSPRRLGIQGGSNGGLLMGVEFTQHPELWRAVDIQVPLLDMLNYERMAAGASWVGEYGGVDNPVERAFLAKISPYQNLKAGVAYPEPLIWTTTKDDRVGPQHARKFAAKLAALGDPYLFYEVTEGGHGSGANLEEKARTAALEMTYFIRELFD